MSDPVKFTVDAILFDMDGTLVNSTEGVVGAWETFAKLYPGLDIKTILSSSHGVRTIDNLRKHCGITDEVELEKQAVLFEKAIVDSSTANGRKGITLLPGVKDIIDELTAGPEDTQTRWAVCTSATRYYASGALTLTGIPKPKVFVTAEDVEKGKPFPDPYLLGAKSCGYEPERCLVVEDAPAGVRSGRAAGCKVIGLLTTHPKEQVEAANPDFLVRDLASVSMKKTPAGIEVVVQMNSSR